MRNNKCNPEPYPEFVSRVVSGSHKMTKQVRHNNAFTLLEIMIVLAIIGITLMTILHTANYHTNLATENTIITQMSQLAKEKLFELEENPSGSEGNFEGNGFTYENIVSETDDPFIFELKTVVRGQGKEITLSELIRIAEGKRLEAK